MSDVVLIFPATGLDVKNFTFSLPLSVLTVASQLTGEFSVRIIDQRGDRQWEQTLIEELADSPLCVGVSAMTGHQILHGLRASAVVKRQAPHVPVVWGGMHVTTMPQQSILHPLIDVVVVGDGEMVFRNLLRALAGKKPLGGVEGIYWKDGGDIRANAPAAPPALDETLELAYDLLDMERYVSPGEYAFPGIRRALPFIASRGCPHRCTFCSQPTLTRVYRKMSPELAVQRVYSMVQRFNLDLVMFYDDEFFADTAWAMRMAELIGGRFRWYTQARANDLLRVDLAALERLGLHTVCPGLESGSPRILKLIKKDETVEQYRQANNLLAQTGIRVIYGMMMGFPFETREDLYQTLDLSMELLERNPNAYLHSLSLFTPLPGTELSEQSRQWGYEPPTDLEGWANATKYSLHAPWQHEQAKMYMNLAYTSWFVGPRARTAFAAAKWIPGIFFRLYDRIIRRRWRRRSFGNTLDVRLLRLAHRWLLNPSLSSGNPGKATAG